MSTNEHKHTPAPWGLLTHGNDNYEVVGGGHQIAVVRGTYNAADETGKPKMRPLDCAEADGLLIAAAPRMEAALEKVSSWLAARWIASDTDMMQSADEMAAAVDGALAEARGEAEVAR